jgi:hypothetical protein
VTVGVDWACGVTRRSRGRSRSSEARSRNQGLAPALAAAVAATRTDCKRESGKLARRPDLGCRHRAGRTSAGRAQVDVGRLSWLRACTWRSRLGTDSFRQKGLLPPIGAFGTAPGGGVTCGAATRANCALVVGEMFGAGVGAPAGGRPLATWWTCRSPAMAYSCSQQRRNCSPSAPAVAIGRRGGVK